MKCPIRSNKNGTLGTKPRVQVRNLVDALLKALVSVAERTDMKSRVLSRHFLRMERESCGFTLGRHD